MEDVLAVYTRPHDPERVLVCLDETSKQLIAETRLPIPMERREQHEQVGGAVALVFVIDTGRLSRLPVRHLDVAPHRHRLCARPERLGRCSLPAQNGHRAGPGQSLNIHSKASLYEAFPPAEARRLVEWFEWHYTPKHGSWLDLAESELGVLAAQCLDRRIADKQTLIDEIAAWEHDRNVSHTKSDWHFTTKSARVKLKHLYPSI